MRSWNGIAKSLLTSRLGNRSWKSIPIISLLLIWLTWNFAGEASTRTSSANAGVSLVSSLVVGSPTVDGNGVKSFPVTSVFQGSQPTILRVLEPDNPAPGIPRRLLYVLPVEVGVTNLSSQYSDGLEELRLLDVHNRYNVTLIAPSFHIDPWYGDHATNPDRRLESFIVHDLVPFGDSFIPPGETPERWLIGFSKSGRGALSLILRHSNVFNAVAAWDSPVQLTDLSAFQGLQENFGTEENFDNYEIPTLVAANATSFNTLNRIWISGDLSTWTTQMAQLHTQMVQAGVFHTWIEGGLRTHVWGSGWLEGAVSSLFANAAPVVPGTPPVAEYSFDEGTGTSAGDSSGNNHTGTISGATWTTQGRFGNALSFDGVNDWVTVNSSSLLNLTTAMTIEAWVFPTTNSGARNVLIKEGVNRDTYNLYARSGGGKSEIYAFIGGENRSAESTALIPNVWTHIAGTYDGTALRLYINGVQVETNNLASGSILTSNNPLRIGGNSIWGEFFQGRLDDVRIYNRALTQAEIQLDLNTPVEDDLVDTVPPIRSNGQPSGILSAGTTQTTLSLTTNENANCRYTTTAGVSYGSMPNTFTTTGGATHSTIVSGLSDGGSYTFFVRCQDASNNVNTDDFTISFSVALAGSGPVAAYGFNEGSGTTLGDSSGNGHTGTISGAAWTTQGKFGNALSFDGVNDWVTVNSSALLSLTTAMTVEAWVFPTTNSGARNVLIKEGVNRDTYNLYARSGGGKSEIYAFIGGENRSAESTAVAANVWTHIAGTYDGTALRLYINGVQVETNNLASGSILTSNNPLRIGGNSIWGEFFQGRLDDVRIYNRALSEEEIQTDMEVPVGGLPPDTTPPVRSNGQPSGILSAGTTQTTLSLTANENANCRYATTAGVSYASMPNTFTTTGGTTHSTTVSGLSDGGSYSFFVRCQDAANNANTDDFSISFSIAQAGVGPVAAYGFNEGSGTSLGDSSGNGHTGTISGAAWTTQGKFGNALSFDGVNDWVTVNSSALLSLTTAMTVEAWVFPTTNSGARNVLIKEGVNRDTYNLYARSGGNKSEIYAFIGGQNRSAESTAVAANVWTHIAGTYDGTTLRLYINGVEVAANNLASGSILTSNDPLRIGGNSIWGEFFQGWIDEIRIYNRALTQAEIQLNMNTPVN